MRVSASFTSSTILTEPLSNAATIKLTSCCLLRFLYIVYNPHRAAFKRSNYQANELLFAYVALVIIHCATEASGNIDRYDGSFWECLLYHLNDWRADPCSITRPCYAHAAAPSACPKLSVKAY